MWVSRAAPAASKSSPQTPRTARGFSGNLILDEFAFHWEAAEPIFSSNKDFLCRIASTGNGRNNLFYQFATGGQFPVSRISRTDAWSYQAPPVTLSIMPRLAKEPYDGIDPCQHSPQSGFAFRCVSCGRSAMQPHVCSRRGFLRTASFAVAGTPLALNSLQQLVKAATIAPLPDAKNANVAIAACKTYGPQEVRAAFSHCFDLLGGVGPLVKNKTVTIKINLTGTNFVAFLNRPVGETYMTHESTAHGLAAALFKAGAKRIVFVESTQSRSTLEDTLGIAGWDVKALSNLGLVEFENTRNLGSGKTYAHFKVPTGGLMFSSFDVNHRYQDTDVMVSLCKLKNHITAGVTLSMKNMFGITPNSLYGDKAGDEEATAGRGPLHNRNEKVKLPGLKDVITSNEAMWRVPRIIVDEIAARPLDLCVIDGITSMSGGEGPWCSNANPLKFTSPGVLIVGFNPVATDAVGTLVMGYPNPRAARGRKPFDFCDNHLLMAEQAGLGPADPARIDIRGLSIEESRYRYDV